MAVLLFDPDGEIISDLVAEAEPPTLMQVKVGKLALDDFYNGTKDTDEEGCIAYVYRAMLAIDRRSRR
jgi:hypothetical protein